MLRLSHKHHYPMCHAVATAAPAVHCNGIQPYRGAACQEGRLLLLSSRRVITVKRGEIDVRGEIDGY